MFTILHISDLHRSGPEPITNDELVSALIGDRSRYVRETPPVTPPQAIVISGDIVQGVPLGTPDASAALAKQYEEAEALITELTERFVGGDRSKVIIVPGNHDVNRVTAQSAMAPVDSAEMPDNLGAELYREGTPYRWDWSTRQLFKIIDQPTYDHRLGAVWAFFERFYEGVPGLLRVGEKKRLEVRCDVLYIDRN